MSTLVAYDIIEVLAYPILSKLSCNPGKQLDIAAASRHRL